MSLLPSLRNFIDEHNEFEVVAYISLLLVSTYIHELGHSLAVIISGGTVSRIIVYDIFNGICYYRGCAESFIILLCGGLFQGLFLLLLSYKKRGFLLPAIGSFTYAIFEAFLLPMSLPIFILWATSIIGVLIYIKDVTQ